MFSSMSLISLTGHLFSPRWALVIGIFFFVLHPLSSHRLPLCQVEQMLRLLQERDQMNVVLCDCNCDSYQEIILLR